MDQQLRPSTIEGIFYPGEKQALADRLHDLLNHSDPAQTQPQLPYSIIVPHAALDYAGAIAAPAFRAAAGRDVRTAVLIGPLHREQQEALLLPQSLRFQTPLGDAEVDRTALDQLGGLSKTFRVDDIPHLEEHCLEAQLPFVQHLFPAARILPILMGKPRRKLAELLSEGLWKLYGQRMARTLFVVTANMTSNTDQRTGQQEAGEVTGWIGSGDWRSLIEAAESKRISSCGAGCVAAILKLNERIGGTIRVLQRGNSLPKVKDPKKVVHYASFVLQSG